MNRTAKLLVGLSVAFNLLFVGILIGHALRPPPMRSLTSPLPLAWVLRDLPETRRDALRPQLREAARGVRPHMRALRAAHAGVETALLRERVDRAELERALAALQVHMRASEATSQRTLVALALQLDRAEREVLVKALRAPLRGPRRQRHDDTPHVDEPHGHPPSERSSTRR